MGRRGVKVPNDVKLKYARMCFEGRTSTAEAARQLDVDASTMRRWIYRYQENGESAFLDTGKNHVYSDELRLEAVLSYLDGEGSLSRIAARYGLRGTRQLSTWIKMYNSGKDFSQRKMSGGSRMTTSRKTTKEERLGWVKRYRELGEAGLEDRRGRRKADQEPRSEVEKLQIEVEQLKHRLYMAEMERDLLKKVRELERKDLYRK